MTGMLGRLLTAVSLVVACAPVARPSAPQSPAQERHDAHTPTNRFRVYLPMSGEECETRSWVDRPAPATGSRIEHAVRAAIEGPTAEEEKRGFRSPFRRSVADPKVPPLRASQVKVVVKGDEVVLDFDDAAGAYLLQAICMRSQVTMALESTLLQFPEVRSVKFAIAGVVIEEWDA